MVQKDITTQINTLIGESNNIPNIIEKLFPYLQFIPFQHIEGGRWGALDNDLNKIYLELNQKYDVWYRKVRDIVKKFDFDSLDQFNSNYDYLKPLLELKKAPRSMNNEHISSFMMDLSNLFETQKSILISIKERIEDGTIDPNDISGTMDNLKKCLVSNIYEYVIKSWDKYVDYSRNIPDYLKLKVKERDHNICQICGEEFPDTELVIDHIFPYCFGGANEEYNLMALCSTCNGDKTNSLTFFTDSGKQKICDSIWKFVGKLNLILKFGEWVKEQNGNSLSKRDKIVIPVTSKSSKKTTKGKKK